MSVIVNHKKSQSLKRWGGFSMAVGIILVVISGINLIFGAMDDSDYLIEISLATFGVGLLIMLFSQFVSGFSIIVHNTENQLAEKGEASFIDKSDNTASGFYCEGEEDKRKE